MAGGGQGFPVVEGLFNRNVPRRKNRGQDTQSLCGSDHSHVRNVANAAAVRGVIGGMVV
jgi:hypothetical protein